ncbi:hypothetical protein ACFXKS_16315 [Streptomyces scopuliridis]|uniref:hypothetical protein n=1 Tax=Streptomyces scopuliridis TaxID=452529 RepID=UPI00368F8080
MPDFHRQPRLRDDRSSRKDYEPFTLIDTLLDANAVRAQSDGKTGFDALKAMRREHPVLVHSLCTYLSVMGLLFALTAATTIQGG